MTEIVLTFVTIITVLFAGITAVIVMVIKQSQAKNKIGDTLTALAPQYGYSYSESATITSSRGLYGDRNSQQLLSGKLPGGKNDFKQFLQIEDRGIQSRGIGGASSLNNKRTCNRIITEVQIPDTLAHFVIKSTHLDRNLTLDNFNSIDGDMSADFQHSFSAHFSTHAPEQDRQQLLAILQPNSMQVLISEFASFDIEIDGDSILFYSYKMLGAEERINMVKSIDVLISKMKLSVSDSKIFAADSKNASATLSRTATNDNTQTKLGLDKTVIIAVLAGMPIFLLVNPRTASIHPFVGVIVTSMIVSLIHKSIKGKF